LGRVFTTRKKLTAGDLKRLTAGTFGFFGDHLAGGNSLPPAYCNSPGVTPVSAGGFAQNAGGKDIAGASKTASGTSLNKQKKQATWAWQG
jgi:hypothetical protein